MGNLSLKLPMSTFTSKRLSPARPRKKHGYHHGDLRRTLVDAALGLVARSGTGALTLREVARHAPSDPQALAHEVTTLLQEGLAHA
jgi:AcrR family transcriptional regulator